jgi:hypothetical protein
MTDEEMVQLAINTSDDSTKETLHQRGLLYQS